MVLSELPRRPGRRVVRGDAARSRTGLLGGWSVLRRVFHCTIPVFSSTPCNSSMAGFAGLAKRWEKDNGTPRRLQRFWDGDAEVKKMRCQRASQNTVPFLLRRGLFHTTR